MALTEAKELVTGGYRVSLAERRALAKAAVSDLGYGASHVAPAVPLVAAPAAYAVAPHAPAPAAAVVSAPQKIVATSVQYETRVYHVPVAQHQPVVSEVPQVTSGLVAPYAVHAPTAYATPAKVAYNAY